MVLKVLSFLLIPVGIYLSVALVLILSQSPGHMKNDGQALDFSSVMTDESTEPLPRIEVTAEDGSLYSAGHLPAPPGRPLLVMLHGSGWHDGQFAKLARALEGSAEIITPPLRGHFRGPGERGDLQYIGQLEDDVAALIEAHAKPWQPVVLLGHSSGGGLVVRFAGGAHGDLIDRAILLAPFLQYDAPTTRPDSGGWARPLTRRIIGLSMLNAVGVHALDGLTAIEFAMPAALRNGPLGDQATLSYSWRLNQSYAPRRDYLSDAAALPPFLLIAGAQDEAFDASAYEPLLAPVNPDGRYEILPGVDHLGVVSAKRTVALIAEALE